MTDVSFVIPAFNEERHLPATLASIRAHAPPDSTYEVIVVDHGSTDSTVALARAAGALVHVCPEALTISELRNIGVRASSGRILVFLDSDSTLTDEWQAAFPQVLRLLEDQPLTISGSTRGIPATAAWVSRMWFSGLDRNLRPVHLGGGHIVTTRRLFDVVEGFPTDLETGEDYEFCMRARRLGAQLVAMPALRVLHHGVPRDAGQFFLRELWHGRGEWQSARAVLTSKVAIATLVFLALHVVAAAGLVRRTATGALIAASAAVAIAALCLGSALAKYSRQGITVVLANCLLFYVYYAARTASLATILDRRRYRRRMRGV